MKIFKTLLAASAMIAVSATASFAGDQYGTWNDSSSQGSGSQILNSQINLQNAWSNLNGSVNLSKDRKTQVFAQINNLFDRSPPTAPQLQYPSNPVYFDLIGTTYRAGLRASF